MRNYAVLRSAGLFCGDSLDLQEFQDESPLRQGNSGGSLIQREGQLSGINFAHVSSVQAWL